MVIDDHASFCADLRALLEAEGFRVVGEAATGRSGIDATLEFAPDVVIVDIGLPDIDGFGVARELEARRSSARVLLTSSRDRASYAKRLADSGLPFVAKDELGADAIQRALES